MARVLVLGDLHCPAMHAEYLPWATGVGKAYRCDQTVLIGDVADFHGMSRFSREVGAPGVDDEHSLTLEQVGRVAAAVPGEVRVCVGNHDSRVMRRFDDAQVPGAARPTFNRIFRTRWRWRQAHVVDGVLYQHGDNCGGDRPAFNLSRVAGCPSVVGHHHSVAGLYWLQTHRGRRWAMDVGCGVDMSSPLMNYARSGARLPVLGCGVVCDGVPLHFVMGEHGA